MIFNTGGHAHIAYEVSCRITYIAIYDECRVIIGCIYAISADLIVLIGGRAMSYASAAAGPGALKRMKKVIFGGLLTA